MPGSFRARRDILELARQMLAGAGIEPTEPLSLTLATGDGGTTLTITSRPGELGQIEDASALPDMQGNIIAALQKAGDQEQTSKQLARTAGYSYSSRFLSALRDLRRQGKIIKGADGYRLARGGAN